MRLLSDKIDAEWEGGLQPRAFLEKLLALSGLQINQVLRQRQSFGLGANGEEGKDAGKQIGATLGHCALSIFVREPVLCHKARGCHG